jgi:PilZ domain
VGAGLSLDGRDNRRHARIETSLDCTVIAGDVDFSAKVANLSRGGAALWGPGGQAAPGTQLLILLERREGDFALALQARVVRVEAQGTGVQYGVHFEDMPPDIDAELLRLLKALASGPGQGRREAPRVAARVRVTCHNRAAIDVGETLGVDFSVGDGAVVTAVAGRAVGVAQLEDGRCRVSLSFEPPSAEEKASVLLLLELMLALGPASTGRVD